MSEGQNSGGEEVKKKRWLKMSERRNRGGEKVEKWWNGKAGQVRERKRKKAWSVEEVWQCRWNKIEESINTSAHFRGSLHYFFH